MSSSPDLTQVDSKSPKTKVAVVDHNPMTDNGPLNGFRKSISTESLIATANSTHVPLSNGNKQQFLDLPGRLCITSLPGTHSILFNI